MVSVLYKDREPGLYVPAPQKPARRVGSPDMILGVSNAFLADPNATALFAVGQAYGETVGPYDSTGLWVPNTIGRIEQTTPVRVQGGYLGASETNEAVDYPGFLNGTARLVFGEYADELLVTGRIAMASTPGGTGALEVFARTVRYTQLGSAGIPKTVMSSPGYPNHEPIWEESGIGGSNRIIKFNQVTDDGHYNFSGHVDAIRQSPAESIAVFQTLDNPTGMNPTYDQWRELAREMKKGNRFALFDIAYAGFGNGFVPDTEAIRIFMSEGVRVAVAFSYSKIGAQYNARTGALLMPMQHTTDAVDFTRTFNGAARTSFSTPPAIGQRVMERVINDETLTQSWIERDLPGFAEILAKRRKLLADGLAGKVPDPVQVMLREGQGMFITLPITPDAVAHLAKEFGIYIVRNGRVNIGAVLTSKIPSFAHALSEVFARPEYVKLATRR